jgi:hypothetical protein
MKGEERSEAGQAIVEEAEALVRERVKLLARNCPSDLLGEASRENLLDLKPHLQGALEALEDIKQRRSLTHKELAQQHAFMMLITWTG